MFNRLENFPRNQVTITPADATDLDRDCIIYCGSAGNIVVQDKNGTQVTYAAEAGDILPVLVRRVLDTNTTVTPVIGLY